MSEMKSIDDHRLPLVTIRLSEVSATAKEWLGNAEAKIDVTRGTQLVRFAVPSEAAEFIKLHVADPPPAELVEARCDIQKMHSEFTKALARLEVLEARYGR